MPFRNRQAIRVLICIAASALQATLATASVESELDFHRGVAAYGEGRLDEAQSRFERVLEETPRDAAALQYLSLITFSKGLDEKAVYYALRAHDANPENLEIRLDLGIMLVSVNRLDQAVTHIDAVLAVEPADAQANLYRGIIAYRAGDFGKAIDHFDVAQTADPELRLQVRYYIALAEASLGNASASAGAFSDVIEQSPAHPLARSAQNLRDGIQPEAQPKNWSVYATAGLEYDSNPTVVGDSTVGNFQEKDDVAGVFRAGGQIQPVDHEGARLQLGYDGFVSLYNDTSDVSQQTHVAWANALLDRDPIRVGVRYDFAYTALSLNDRFRLLHRVLPSISLRNNDWGVTRLAYEFQASNFDDRGAPAAPLVGPDDFNRSGPQHSIGLDQFVLLPAPLTFAQVGARATTFQSDGSEFDYQGFDVVFGTGVGLPFESDLRFQYRFQYRDYDGRSRIDPANPESRIDEVHYLNVDLRIPILAYLDLSIAGSFIFNDSKVSFYQYDRQIVGTYLTARY